MGEQRPDPDELLARVQRQEARTHRGRLKIFFGAAAGVGKTYSMLEAAQTRRAEGVDVIAGYIEPHNRPETKALLAGLEVVPPRVIDYRGAQLREFDLDAALARKPTLILVDELAHTNAPGSRHAKRWQDIEELLSAGINVYTTVNVQHVESMNDVVTQITGAVVRETIPDSILEHADEVELVDVSPDELLIRLREGKVYLPQQAESAGQNFFRKGNLMALRELALRHTAERVDEQMQAYRQEKAIAQIWPAGERIMVCISASPLAPRLVRAAKRMATGLRAEWIAAYVETPRAMKFSEAERNQIIQTLRLAEQLGADTVTLAGHNVIEEILTYARKHNVTKVVVGKPAHPIWRDFLFGSVLNNLIRQSGSIDVYVISGEGDAPQPTQFPMDMDNTIHWKSHLKAMGVVVICTLVALLLSVFDLTPANLIMIYLVGIVHTATHYGRTSSVLASVVSVLTFDYFFAPPPLTFAVSDTQYLITFAVMMLVALTVSNMTIRIKEQAEASRERERRTAGLYEMSREFASNNEIEELARIAANHIENLLESQVVLLLPGEGNEFRVYSSEMSAKKLTAEEKAVAQWAYDHGQAAGFGTMTLPSSSGIYLPLRTPQGKVGILGVFLYQPTRVPSPDRMHLLETFANQTALALERARLAEEAENTRLQIETERMRSILLSSVSHDLRTPLAAIIGAISGLLQRGQGLDERERELAQIVYEEAERLNRLLGNLLEMTRLESGTVTVEKEWQPLEEVVGTTLLRLDPLLVDHPLITHLPEDLPLVPIDAILIEQVLVNLLENAVKYSPAGSPIELSATAESREVVVEISDCGSGLPLGEEDRIFDKFYRIRPATAGGVGLGLAICKAAIEAHGGRIWAKNREAGGATFRFTLPLGGEQPLMDWGTSNGDANE